MKISINVENIRCGGCANTITKKLSAIEGINAVEVAIEDQVVTIDTDDESVRDADCCGFIGRWVIPRKVRLKDSPHSKARPNRL